MVAFILLIGLVLSIPGTILGLKDKLVIYNGKSDLNMTCFIVMFAVVTGLSFLIAQWLGILLVAMVSLFMVHSIHCSYRANGTLVKTLLVVPTKFSLLGLIALCGLFAVGGSAAALNDLKENKKGDAARHAAVGASGAAGYVLIKKLLAKLVKENAYN